MDLNSRGGGTYLNTRGRYMPAKRPAISEVIMAL